MEVWPSGAHHNIQPLLRRDLLEAQSATVKWREYLIIPPTFGEGIKISCRIEIFSKEVWFGVQKQNRVLESKTRGIHRRRRPLAFAETQREVDSIGGVPEGANRSRLFIEMLSKSQIRVLEPIQSLSDGSPVPPAPPRNRFLPLPKERLNATTAAHGPTRVICDLAQGHQHHLRERKGMDTEMLHGGDRREPRHGKSTLHPLMGEREIRRHGELTVRRN